MKTLILIIQIIIREIHAKMAAGQGTLMSSGDFNNRPFLGQRVNSSWMDSIHLISCKERLEIVGFFQHFRRLQKENLLQQELSNQLSMGQMQLKKEACIDFNFTIWANGMISSQTIRFLQNTLPGEGSTDGCIQAQNNRSISRRPENSELWVALVEKAFAKFFGSYKNIIGGDCIWTLLNLNGGFTFDVKDFRGKNSGVPGVRNFHNFHKFRN